MQPEQLELAKRAVTMLSRLYEADPNAVRKLIDTRATIDIGAIAVVTEVIFGEVPPATLTIGTLGLINGLIGCALVAAEYDRDGTLLGFRLQPKEV